MLGNVLAWRMLLGERERERESTFCSQKMLFVPAVKLQRVCYRQSHEMYSWGEHHSWGRLSRCSLSACG